MESGLEFDYKTGTQFQKQRNDFYDALNLNQGPINGRSSRPE